MLVKIDNMRTFIRTIGKPINMLIIKKIIAIWALAAFFFSTTLVWTPDGNCITIQEERELAKEFMAVVKSQYPLIEDPVIVDYVNRVGNRILKSIPPPAVRLPVSCDP